LPYRGPTQLVISGREDIKSGLSRRNNIANRTLAKLFLLIKLLSDYAAATILVNMVLLKAAIKVK